MNCLMIQEQKEIFLNAFDDMTAEIASNKNLKLL